MQKVHWLEAAIEGEKKDRERLKKIWDSYIDGTPTSGTEVLLFQRQILMDARDTGYKVWAIPGAPESNPFMLQKCFRNDRGDRLYFIDLSIWDMAREFDQADRRWGPNIAPSVHFYRGERHGPSERPVTVECFVVKGEKLKDIEDFFAEFYVKMFCVPYETMEGG